MLEEARELLIPKSSRIKMEYLPNYRVNTRPKTLVKLWPGLPEEYGSGLIKIDGITRQNLGAGIGDKISLRPIESVDAGVTVLSKLKKLA